MSSPASFNPIRGSEDDPELTLPQKAALRTFVETPDEVRHRLRLDGTLHVETVDYDEAGYSESCHVVHRDGIAF